MTTPDSKVPEATTAIPTPGHAVEIAAGAMGAIGGAVAGAMGGPVGAIAGAVIGGVMGASGGWAAEQQSAEQSAVDAELDDDIGVTAGTIGSPNLKHPPSTLNAPSAAAAGVTDSAGSATDAEGPMQAPDD